jgi:hypothetical protein
MWTNWATAASARARCPARELIGHRLSSFTVRDASGTADEFPPVREAWWR